MNKLYNFFKKKYAWAATLGIILILSTTYTMLDTFVIPKAYIVINDNSENVPDASENAVSQAPVYAIAASSPAAGIESKTLKAADASKPAISEYESKTSVPAVSQNVVSRSPVQQPVIQSKTAEPKAAVKVEEPKPQVVITENSYSDENIKINVEKKKENGCVFYVADVKVAGVKYLKTAFAENTFGRNITQPTSEMAKAHNAIFAVNGDYYGFRDGGLIIRNGVLYRDIPRTNGYALIIDNKGDMNIIAEGEAKGDELVKKGVIQSFSFGPGLVKDGKVDIKDYKEYITQIHPRTAVGQVGPLHYIFIVADGRSDESKGMYLNDLANEFVKRGAQVAYNLDGGGSATMWLNGNVVNNPTDGVYKGEREVSDILYIAK